ncbi:MAG: KpsF/GutQ family sugar-phosphate isomerase [Kiloniellales bacterium]|nr:KpsF/GutQ family sugar-phosphate isomerase [Kiloniellales bacterium]
MSARPRPALPLASKDIEAAQRTLRLEAEAISALSAGLDDGFVEAVDLISKVQGRVVVTGMGKSGHIARKIAATLASTGTPAIYVHPGEASHGDLGMLTVDDAVMALSNSGNTAELSDIVAFTRRFGISLVGMTSAPKSTLAEQSDVALILPKAPEACPMGLAPTTSTTVMLALGDALAVALLERRGFTPQDFQVLHPGGTLGGKLARVSELMQGRDGLPIVTRETPVAEAILVMTQSFSFHRSFGCVGIADDDGRLVGIVTDGDLRRHMNSDLLDRPAKEIMTGKPQTIRPQALAAEALGLMNAKQITSLFVVEDEKPVGFLHIHDCLRAGVG